MVTAQGEHHQLREVDQVADPVMPGSRGVNATAIARKNAEV